MKDDLFTSSNHGINDTFALPLAPRSAQGSGFVQPSLYQPDRKPLNHFKDSVTKTSVRRNRPKPPMPDTPLLPAAPAASVSHLPWTMGKQPRSDRRRGGRRHDLGAPIPRTRATAIAESQALIAPYAGKSWPLRFLTGSTVFYSILHTRFTDFH